MVGNEIYTIPSFLENSDLIELLFFRARYKKENLSYTRLFCTINVFKSDYFLCYGFVSKIRLWLLPVIQRKIAYFGSSIYLT